MSNWWDDVAGDFAADIDTLDPPATWVQLARMARAGTFPTERHRAVHDTWKERAARHYSEVGTSGTRSMSVTPIPKAGKK